MTLFDVCHYITTKYGPQSMPRLNLLCFFCQGWHLVWTGEKLFMGTIVVGVGPPIIRNLQAPTREHVQDKLARGNMSRLTESQTSTIDAVLEAYVSVDWQVLFDQSKLGPWKSWAVGRPITTQALQAHFQRVHDKSVCPRCGYELN